MSWVQLAVVNNLKAFPTASAGHRQGQGRKSGPTRRASSTVARSSHRSRRLRSTMPAASPGASRRRAKERRPRPRVGRWWTRQSSQTTTAASTARSLLLERERQRQRERERSLLLRRAVEMPARAVNRMNLLVDILVLLTASSAVAQVVVRG